MKNILKKAPPLYSFIIATRNISIEFNNTMDSIVSQNFKDYEIIVVDSSTELNSKNIILSRKDSISKLIIENDNGIYEAWNKALKITSGDWIVFLGSGDSLVKGILNEISNIITLQKNIDLFISNIIIFNQLGKKKIIQKIFSSKEMLKYKQPPHPGIFMSKKLFLEFGNFNENYKIAGDYEFLLRISDKINYKHLDITSVEMMGGGVSTSLPVLKEGIKAQLNHPKMTNINLVFHNLKFFIFCVIKNFKN